mgnify:CR=1 FL=1
MKERSVCIVVLFLSLIVCLGCKNSENNTFKRLKGNEYLDYESFVLSTSPYHEMTIVNIKGAGKKRKILSIQGNVISSYKDQTTHNANWIILAVCTWNDPMSRDASELWFVDGRVGVCKKLLSSISFEYLINPDGKYIFIEDFFLESSNNRTPIASVYKLPEMKKIKEVVYDKFVNTSLHVQELSYKNGTFYFTLEDDGNLYSDEKIDISSFINNGSE